jgi:hypothetical protein
LPLDPLLCEHHVSIKVLELRGCRWHKEAS